MQETSALYKRLFAGAHRVETRVAIGDVGILIDERGDSITFGGVRILVARSGAEAGFDESILMSVTTMSQVFGEDKPEVGCCVSSEIELTMLKPSGEIPRMAQVVPYVRLTDGVEYSEWIQKGVYYIDTRSHNNDDSGIEILTLHGYDAMMKSEQDYTGSALAWPNTDINVVKDIARIMGVQVEPETVEKLAMGYTVQLPAGYTCREVLGYVAAMYAGCFVMSDLGELKLIQLNTIPKETRYLVDSAGYAITFGGDRIKV